MKLNRKIAAAIFQVGFNFKLADKWEDGKLNKRLSTLPEFADEDALAKIKDPEVLSTINAVLKALHNGETVTVDDSPEADTDTEAAAQPKQGKAAKAAKGKAKPEADEPEGDEPEPAADDEPEPAGDDDEKPAKKPAKPAKVAKEKKAPKEKKEAAVDKFNNRVGSQGAIMNAAFSKRWQTIAELAEEVKLSVARVRSHAKYLEKRKLAEYDAEKGVRLI